MTLADKLFCKAVIKFDSFVIIWSCINNKIPRNLHCLHPRNLVFNRLGSNQQTLTGNLKAISNVNERSLSVDVFSE
jgi:hypothetical protein